MAPRRDDPLDLLRRHQSPAAALAASFAGSGAHEVSADGARVLLSDGRSLVDFGSYAVTLLGHRPPMVVRAVEQQLARLPTSTRTLPNAVAPTFAARLVELVDPDRLRKVWLGANGSDAVEAALKLARLATGRARVLALEGGYHGKSLGALGATHNPRYRAGLEDVLPPAIHVASVDAASAALRQGDVAAFVFEPIQGEGGVRPIERALLAAICAEARRVGTFVVADEVQTGLRRCGPISLSVAWGLEPDAVLFGKVLGGGVLPLSAVVCSDELHEPFGRDPFLHTMAFSGHPLSCAAGLSSLDAIEGIEGQVASLSARWQARLKQILADHPDVLTSARGRGLMWGVECRSVESAGHVLAELTPNGLVHSPCLGRPDVLRMLPPVVATDADLDVAASALAAGCDEARAAMAVSRPPAAAVRTTVNDGGVTHLAVVPEATQGRGRSSA